MGVMASITEGPDRVAERVLVVSQTRLTVPALSDEWRKQSRFQLGSQCY